MYEVWQDRGDPAVWLVFRESPSFPSAFAVEEWLELGSCAVHVTMAAVVDQGGYLLIRAPGSSIPPPPSGRTTSRRNAGRRRPFSSPA